MTPEEEERGWTELLARWSEDEAHRAWLAGFSDLEGLARAGQRYRDVLARSPGDAVAARWRDEIVKRATVHGLASLPRTSPRPPVPHAVKVGAVALLAVAILGALVALARQLLSFARAP